MAMLVMEPSMNEASRSRVWKLSVEERLPWCPHQPSLVTTTMSEALSSASATPSCSTCGAIARAESARPES